MKKHYLKDKSGSSVFKKYYLKEKSGSSVLKKTTFEGEIRKQCFEKNNI
ncbi:hypothetical protein MTBBW1_1670050 [Desulfamplus magnetovallimortis]|uniref:Uncharacterized protein n=1 Tax=Desulfamplus magnetovallimortis TaxID=1246637 RepID=A0A1W1H9B6_9BACT|nr:hypothetical protein MTBBW1_1670050 [Desulfamplus magnetovallimortis]